MVRHSILVITMPSHRVPVTSNNIHFNQLKTITLRKKYCNYFCREGQTKETYKNLSHPLPQWHPQARIAHHCFVLFIYLLFLFCRDNEHNPIWSRQACWCGQEKGEGMGTHCFAALSAAQGKSGSIGVAALERMWQRWSCSEETPRSFLPPAYMDKY